MSGPVSSMAFLLAQGRRLCAAILCDEDKAKTFPLGEEYRNSLTEVQARHPNVPCHSPEWWKDTKRERWTERTLYVVDEAFPEKQKGKGAHIFLQGFEF